MTEEIRDLIRALERTPVMGNIHPLVPLCLPVGVEIIKDIDRFVDELDALAPHPVRPVLALDYDARYEGRFSIQNAPTCPPSSTINAALSTRVDCARRHLLTHRRVADRIVADAIQENYETVVLFLVDGLSYDDIRNWPDQIAPCFIDGPSITFGQRSDGTISDDVGFPGVVGTPSVARRLMDAGILHSYGFSYWNREQNEVSALLFRGMPLIRVRNMGEALDQLVEIKLPGLYVQLVREGLDGLAHHRREITEAEVRSAISAIRDDFRRMVDLLVKSKVKGAVYLTADHGILWKKSHEGRFVEVGGSAHPRYGLDYQDPPHHTTRFDMRDRSYFLYHYPYLGARIRANDAGVHGGLSYWESIVPFVKCEVNR